MPAGKKVVIKKKLAKAKAVKVPIKTQSKGEAMKQKSVANVSNKVKITKRESLRIKASNFVGANAAELRNCYTIGKMLGSGAFGEVSLCVHKASGDTRAVKMLRKTNMKEAEIKEFFNEVNVLKSMDHPNILKMYEFFEDA